MSESPDPQNTSAETYWKKNIRCVLILLTAWFIASYGCGILFVDELNEIRIPGSGFKLGFWFAQQGSIYVFVALIGIYVWYMNKLDQELSDSKNDDQTDG